MRAMPLRYGVELTKSFSCLPMRPRSGVERRFRRRAGSVDHDGAILRRYRGKTPMSNQVVLVTGALTGIGRATALAFARAGAQVVVSGRRDAAGEALAGEL